MKPLYKIIFSTLVLMLLSSCGLVYKVLLGVDTKLHWESTEEVEKQAKKYNISTTHSFLQDTVLYRATVDTFYRPLLTNLHIEEGDSSHYFKIKKVRKDDLQPVQFRLFKHDGEEIFKIVNCYVDPPIPMNWNVDGCFDTFPAKTDIEALNEHYFDLNLILKSTRKSNGELLKLSDLPKAEYYGVILWNNFLKRPSKKLIKTVQKHVAKQEEDVHLIYVYNQHAYLWPYLNVEQKQKVIEASTQNKEK